jgi:outer membrane protein assembly factor BamA
VALVRSVLLLTALAIAAGYVVVRHLPDEPEASAAITDHPQQIASVSIDGLDAGRTIPVSALRSVLATKAGDALDAQKIDHDRAAMTSVLEARGYLAAKIDAPSVTFADGHAYVVYSVSTGQVFHFRNVTSSGIGARDRGLITIGAWDTASPERIERVRQALAETAANVKKSVVASTHIDASAAAIDVDFTVR